MKRKNWICYGLISALALAAIAITVPAAEPGTQDDPLITKSYIDEKVLPQIYDYIDNKGSETQPNSTQPPTAAFVVVSVEKGERLIADAGCELIIRQGAGEIIATEKGGIADVTLGGDLSNKTAAPSNHLLIVPLADGRGISAKTDMLIMVKGKYTIE